MSFLVFFSFSWFQKKIYEYFLLFHIIMAVFTIVGMWL